MWWNKFKVILSKNLESSEVGQDRIEKILTSSEFQVLSKRLSINLKKIQFSSNQTECAEELNRKFLEDTASTINKVDENIDTLVRISCCFMSEIH